ncbi:MAG: hypothetical protein KJO07_06285 [Deltaproteobacteria bacterium]|nr:hypothetical protein [Deltaproteobacteria bacterium]
MRTLAVVLVTLITVACGGEDGERLLQSEIAVDYQGDSFDPVFGYAQFIDWDNDLDAPGHVLLSTSEFECKRDGSGRPENGVVVTVGLPQFIAGSYENVAVDFTRYRSGLAIDQTMVAAPIEVLEADDEIVSLAAAFDETVDGEPLSLTGELTVLRCN